MGIVFGAKFSLDASEFNRELKKAGTRTDMFGKDLSILASKIGVQFVGVLQQASRQLKNLATEMTVVGAQFEQSIVTLGAISGARPEALSAYTEEARKLGASTAYTATEAAEGMQELARAGMQTNEILNITGNALKFAGANAVTMQKSTKLLAATMRQFNKSADQSNQILDAFTTATQNSLFDVESLAVAMRYGGSVGASLGASLNETVAVMASFRDLGLEGSMVGTRFRQALLSLASPTRQAKDLLAQYNLTAKDLDLTTNGITGVIRNLGNAGLITAQHLAPIVSKRAAGSVANLAKRLQNTISLTDLEREALTRFDKSIDELDSSEIEKIEKALTKVANANRKGLKPITRTVDKIDLLQIKMMQNAGVTEKTYKQMIGSVSGQFKILQSAIQESFISTFTALNTEYNKLTQQQGQKPTLVPDTSRLVTFTKILEDAKSIVDSFNDLINANGMLLQGYFTRVYENIQLIQNNITGGKYNLDEFFARVVVNIVSATDALIRFAEIVSRYAATIFKIGKMAVFVMITTQIRKAAFHFAQFMRQVAMAPGALLSMKEKVTGTDKIIKATATGTKSLLNTLNMISYQLQVIMNQLQAMGPFAASISNAAADASGQLMSQSRLNAQYGPGYRVDPLRKDMQEGALLAGTVALGATTGGKATSPSKKPDKKQLGFFKKLTTAIGGASAAGRGFFALLGRIGGALVKFISGPWGLLLTAIPLLFPLFQTLLKKFGLTKDAVENTKDSVNALSEATAEYAIIQDKIKGYAESQVASGDMANTYKNQDKLVKSTKQYLLQKGQLTNQLISELNLVRDMTDERKKEMTDNGQLLEMQVDLGNGLEKILLTQEGIRLLEKTSLNDKDVMSLQLQGHLENLEKQTLILSERDKQELKFIQSLQAEATQAGKNTVLFGQQMAVIMMEMQKLGFKTADLTSNEEGLAVSIARVNGALAMQAKRESTLDKFRRKRQDMQLKEQVDLQERARRSGSRRKSKLAKIEQDIYRERLKIAAKRINETKKLEQQFYIEDIRARYDEEVKYFGKTRAQMLKIEKSYVNALITIAETSRDKYFQELTKLREETSKGFALLAGGIKTDIDIEYQSNLKELAKQFEELENVTIGNFQATAEAASRKVDLGIKIDPKQKEALSNDLAMLQEEIALRRSGLDAAIAELDKLYSFEELREDPKLLDEYNKQIATLNQGYVQELRELGQNVADGASGLTTLEQAFTDPNNKQLLNEYFLDIARATDVQSDTLYRILKTRTEREVLLEKQKADEVGKINKEHQELIDGINETAALQYDLPYLQLQKDKQANFEKLIEEEATLEQLQQLQAAYSALELSEQKKLTDGLVRQYGDYTDEIMALRMKEYKAIIPFRKRLLNSRMTYLEEVYSLEKKYAEDLANIESTQVSQAEFDEIDKAQQEEVDRVLKINNELREAQQEALETRQRFVDDLNSLAVKTGITDENNVIIGIDYDENQLLAVQEKLSIEVNNLMQDLGEEAQLELQIGAENVLFGGEEAVKNAEELAKSKSKELEEQQNIGKTIIAGLVARKEALKIRNEEAESSKETLKNQFDQNKALLKQKNLILILKTAYSVIQKITEVGLKGIKLTFEATKRLYESLTKVFSFLTGGKVSFNLFETLQSGIEDFIGKQEEAIAKQKELGEQLESRQITQEEYDKAIAGGVGKVDNRAFARKFVEDMIDGAVAFADAFTTQSASILMFFNRELPKVFLAVQKAFPEVVKALLYYGPSIMQTIRNGLTGMLPMVFTALQAVWTNTLLFIERTLIPAFPVVVGYMTKAIISLSNMLIAQLPRIVSNITSLLPVIGNAVVKLIDQAFKALPNILPLIVQFSEKFYSIMFGIVSRLLGQIIANLPVILENAIMIVLGIAKSSIISLVKLLENLVMSGLPKLLNGLVDGISRLLVFIGSELGNIIGYILARLPKILYKLVEFVVKGLIMLIFKGIPQIVMALAEGLINIFKNIGQQIGDLIRGKETDTSGLLDEAYSPQELANNDLGSLFGNITDQSDFISPYDSQGALKAFGETQTGGASSPMLTAITELNEQVVPVLQQISKLSENSSLQVYEMLEQMNNNLSRIVKLMVISGISSVFSANGVVGIISASLTGLIGIGNTLEGLLGNTFNIFDKDKKQTDAEKGAERRRKDLLKEIFTLGIAKTGYKAGKDLTDEEYYAQFGDTPGVIQAGMDGLMARFKAGDYVIAAQKPTDVLAQALQMFSSGVQNLTMPTMNANMLQSSGQAMPPIDIAVIADGRLLDAVQVNAMERGQAPKMNRMLRRASGVDVGFNRGKFNRF